MVNADAGLQVAGKFFGDLSREPVLSRAGLQETPGQQEQQEDRQENSKEYFKEFPQGVFVYVKVANQALHTN